MIKQITNEKGSFLFFNDTPIYKLDIIEIINSGDKINIQNLKNFPKSLLNGHPIKKMICNKDYNTKVKELENRYDYSLYDKNKNIYNITWSNDDILSYLQIDPEPNIKIVNKNAFYDYYNSFNDPITEDELMELLNGFKGSKEDVNLTMK